MVNESSERLMNTVTNIMDISLIVSGNQAIQVRNIPICPLLDEIFTKFNDRCVKSKLALTLHKDQDADGFLINSDPELLSKILNHLIDNAIKFTRKGTIAFGFKELINEVGFL